MGLALPRQHEPQRLLGAGLADRAGDGDDLAGEFRPARRAGPLHRAQHVGDDGAGAGLGAGADDYLTEAKRPVPVCADESAHTTADIKRLVAYTSISHMGYVLIGIYAGDSPLSQQLALRIPPEQMPLGICTSAGTVGPSISLGKTDATVTLAASASLADAYASTLGNLVQTADDIPAALAVAPKLPGLLGCVIILGDKLGAWGQVELAPL